MKSRLTFGLFLFLLVAPRSFAQDPLDGLWQGYDGEWRHVSQQLVALAEATPAENFAWRPAKGVRSTSEVYMHIAMANFGLLSYTGPKIPPDLKQDAEKTVTSKARSSVGSSARWRRSGRRMRRRRLRTSPAKSVSKTEMQLWMACISASSFTTTSIWGSWSHTHA